MAKIIVNPDNSLSLDLTTDERSTYDGLIKDQLDNFLTVWLADRFKNVWRDRVARLTTQQKQDLLALITESMPSPPTPEPAPTPTA